MTIFLVEGLGNQMFQYAFARRLSLEKNCKLHLNVEQFRHKLYYSDNSRKFSLDKFNLSDDVVVDSGLFSRVKGYVLGKVLIPIYEKIYPQKDKFFEKYLVYVIARDVYSYCIIDCRKISNRVMIYGQFQSPKWFLKYDDIIRKELKVKALQSVSNQILNKNILDTESVCLHIRRGDYLNPEWQHLNVCNYEYYLNAMKYVRSRVDNATFFVFSNCHDDIEWIKNNYNFDGFNVVYVDESNPDYEELRLMYSCKHFILSNSSFSWWAQYLSDNKGKIVCAPSKWMNDSNTDCSDIYMDNWTVIDTSENQ